MANRRLCTGVSPGEVVWAVTSGIAGTKVAGMENTFREKLKLGVIPE